MEQLRQVSKWTSLEKLNLSMMCSSLPNLRLIRRGAKEQVMVSSVKNSLTFYLVDLLQTGTDSRKESVDETGISKEKLLSVELSRKRFLSLPAKKTSATQSSNKNSMSSSTSPFLMERHAGLGELDPSLYEDKNAFRINVALKYSIMDDVISVIILKCTLKARKVTKN